MAQGIASAGSAAELQSAGRAVGLSFADGPHIAMPADPATTIVGCWSLARAMAGSP
jgi:hypothetical protein